MKTGRKKFPRKSSNQSSSHISGIITDHFKLQIYKASGKDTSEVLKSRDMYLATVSKSKGHHRQTVLEIKFKYFSTISSPDHYEPCKFPFKQPLAWKIFINLVMSGHQLFSQHHQILIPSVSDKIHLVQFPIVAGILSSTIYLHNISLMM